MPPDRRAILLLTACLLVALLVTSVVAGVEEASRHPSGAVTVPTGRVGDTYTYVLFEGEANDAWAPFGSWVGRMDAPLLKTDREGGLRQTVPVASRLNFTFDGTAWRSLLGVAGEAVPEQQVFQAREVLYLDPTTRRAVQGDWETGFLEGFVFTDFAPLSPLASLHYQGRTLRVGEDLSHLNPAPDPSLRAWFAGGASGSYLGFPFLRIGVDSVPLLMAGAPGEVVSYASSAVGTTMVEGEAALEVRTTAHVRVPDPLPPEVDYEPYSKWRGQEVRVTTTEWLSASRPVPLLIEVSHDRMIDGRPERLQAFRYALVAVEEGSLPIDWSDITGGGGSVWDGGRADHAQPVVDGAGATIPYSFARLQEDLEGPLAPVTLRLWRDAHPGHRLVSAELTLGERSTPSAPTHAWHLAFATPDGTAREVVAERGADDAPVIQDLGDTRVDPFQADEIPGARVTIAQLERVHQRVLGTSGPLNHVHWGYPLSYRSSPLCPRGLDRTNFGDWGDLRHELRLLRVGSTNLGSCAEAGQSGPEGLMLTQARVSAVVADLTTGELVTVYRVDKSLGIPAAFSWTGDERPPSVRPLSVVATTHWVGLRPPPVGPTLLTWAGLAGLAFVAYFAPALKVWSGHALLLLPGYAKLRKDELLDHRVRDQLVQAVQEEPGLTATELRRRVGVGWGTVVHHLRVLEKNRLVSSVAVGRNRRFFLVGAVDAKDRGRLALLRNARTRGILEAVCEEPGLQLGEIAARHGVTSAGALWHLHRLEGAGLVGAVREGRRVQYFPCQEPSTPAVAPQENMEVA